ncbi:hypothetical protein QC763_400753 [Podospora pseudopauciseta]|uniref:Uncharacterized protein n=1 Tax=Podospora pseudopauciseta TaxID=2093780 RepID=A0ABR0HBD8_9PEZI|nr:hypothetical protein QC763_400753 [Podospora pseudopauciseta]
MTRQSAKSHLDKALMTLGYVTDTVVVLSLEVGQPSIIRADSCASVLSILLPISWSRQLSHLDLATPPDHNIPRV